MNHIWRLSMLAATAIATVGLAIAQGPAPTANALVRQIDHIVIETDQPEKLFHLFSDKFVLPLGWPYRSYGKFSSGGVGFGNVILEPIHVESLHTGIAGVALEPLSVAEAIAGLDARGLKHGAPAPVYQKDPSGNQHLGWTTVDLQMSVDGFFFCKYEASVEPRRTRIQSELQARSGGPLGIVAVTEVVVGVRDMANAQREFRALLGPPRAGEEAVWAAGNGPAVRLIADKEDHITQLRVKVKSLERARAFLKSEGLLGDDTGHELSLERSQLGETGIRFFE